MGRLVVAVDPGVEVSPADLAAAWESDGEARAVGAASVEMSGRGDFLPDVLTLVVIPLGVNVASTAACALVSRLVARLRPARPDQLAVELAETAGDDGDRVVVVRVSGTGR